MSNLQYKCPYCGHDSTLIAETNYAFRDLYFNIDSNIGKMFGYRVAIYVCPNPDCKKLQIRSFLFSSNIEDPVAYSCTKEDEISYQKPDDRISIYHMKYHLAHTPEQKKTPVIELMSYPIANAKIFPDYIPVQLRTDYNEACAILKLSPKASATLARRCLQGMIRDFWGIKDNKLQDAINKLKDRIDPLIWNAIEGVRNIGNIGAHMEKDINLIIDVDPEEADKLIWLLEFLFKEWYITRHERVEKLTEIKAIADVKKEARKG